MKINPRVLVMREVVGKVVEMLASRQVRVTQQGTKAFVESDIRTGRVNRVNLPYLPDDCSDELLEAVQGYLDHEVGHLLFTDLQLLAKLGQGKDGKYKFLLNVLEDTFIEREMAKQYAGSGANLEVTQRFVLDKVVQPAILSDGPQMGNLIMPLMRAMSGQTVMRDFLKPLEATIKPIVDALGPDFPALVQGITSTADTGKVADEFMKRLRDNAPPMPEDQPQHGEPDDGGDKGEGDKDDDEKPQGKDKSKPEEKDDEEGTDEQDQGDAQGEGDEEETDDGDTGDDDEGDTGEGEGEGGKGGDAGDEDDDDGATGEDQEGEGDGSTEGEESEGEESDDAEDSEGGGDGEGNETEQSGKPRPQVLDDDSEIDSVESEARKDAPTHGQPGDANNDVAGADEREDLLDALEGLTEDADYDSAAAKAIEQEVSEVASDSEYLVFTTDHDRIEPIRVPGDFDSRPGHVQMMRELIDRTEHMVSPMQKDLERAVAARSAAVFTSGHRSGRLHGPSLARITMGRDDVFCRKQVNKTKDVAVELVVDGSGSMRDKIQTATSAAYALSMTLERLSIVNEVIAFTTEEFSRRDANELVAAARKLGRPYSRQEALYMPIIKEFSERNTTDIKRRFTMLANFFHDGLRSNVDGESVLVAYRRLMQQRAARKVMIVLSDGYPACMGDMHALRRHLKDSVRMIESRGVDVIGIGIRSEAVKEFYRKSVVLNDVAELPGTVMQKLKELLIVAGN